MRFERTKQRFGVLLHLVQAWGLRVVKGAHAGKNLMRAVGEPWRQFCGIGMGQEHVDGMLVHGDVALQPGLGPVLGGVLAFHPVVHRTEGVVRERGTLLGQGQPEGVVLGEVVALLIRVVLQDLGARSHSGVVQARGPKQARADVVVAGGFGPHAEAGAKHRHGSPHHVDFRVVVQVGKLPFDSVWRHPVVGVHPNHHRRPHICNACVESGHDAPVLLKPNDAVRPLQRGLHTGGQRGGVAVVRQHHVEVLAGLRVQIAQHFLEVGVGSIARNDNGSAHGRLKVTNLQPDDV